MHLILKRNVPSILRKRAPKKKKNVYLNLCFHSDFFGGGGGGVGEGGGGGSRRKRRSDASKSEKN